MMKTAMLYITTATILVNFVMAILLSNVGGEFKRSVRASIIAALLANLWAVGALLILSYPINAFGGLGRYLFLIAPMAIMYWLILFADNFPFSNKILSKNLRRVISVFAGLAMLGTALFAPYMIFESSNNIGELYEPSVTLWFYIIYSLYFALYSLIFSRTFLRKIQQLPDERKRQAWYAYRGTQFSSFFAFLTNLLLPMLGVTSLLWAGPASSFIYAVSFLYAMRRYRLFEIRRFALRAAVYTSALVVAVGLYALLMNAIRQAVVNFTGVKIEGDIFYSVMTVVAVFMYVPLRRLFDQATKRFFFKNDYEIQNVIDALGGVLLRAKLRKDIATKVSGLLRATLLTDKVEVILEDIGGEKADDLKKFFTHHRKSIVSVDAVENPDAVAQWMRAHRYEIVVRIRSQAKDMGWIVLGEKRSGDAYHQKDITLLDIASDEIAIAMESSLQFELIEEFNRTLQDRVGEATKKLRNTNKKLQDLDETKDEFISMASHQLRTPLTSVKGYLSMVLEGDVGEINPQQRKLLEEAFSSSQRMVYLIGDFLNVSRIQTGKFELERADVSLPNIISEEISQLKATAKSRGIELAYEAPRDFPVMSIDENKIRQVMMNFIDNAIYYSPENTTITVSLAKFDNRIEFKVTDQGIGVPKEARQHLFTKFFRADNAKQQRPDGTGIGLFMAKKVVIEHGGAILFESEHGKGSMFGFRLPLSEPKTPLES